MARSAAQTVGSAKRYGPLTALDRWDPLLVLAALAVVPAVAASGWVLAPADAPSRVSAPSPFAHLADVPEQAPHGPGLVVMTVLAMALVLVGLVGLRATTWDECRVHVALVPWVIELVSRASAPLGGSAGGRQVEPGHQDVRASDRERELAIDRLTRALGQGRLSLPEFEDRVASAHAALTRTELAELTRDLPGRLW